LEYQNIILQITINDIEVGFVKYDYREPLKTPVGFPEVPRRKSLIPYNV
jgi:hypothetical protein